MTSESRRALLAAAVVALASAAAPAFAASEHADAAADPIASEMEALLAAAYPADGPGAAVLVTRGGEVLLRQGYGRADLEHEVAVRPETAFRIGSVTKQFTAVAVLLLLQDGKLALDDPLTRFLPDFPTHGATITIRHLLTHTSGIPSYTDFPAWRETWGDDLTLDQLIATFRGKPLEFPPGSRWKYSNSAYVLLGSVIEKASGMRYEEFLARRVFAPLELRATAVDDGMRLVKHRADGYQKGSNEGDWRHAPYLSMTHPFSAGALISTVDDLGRWNEALWSGKLVPSETLLLAHQPFRLPGGAATAYGFGWALGNYEGRRVIEHGGGIHGFVAETLSLPEDHVYVAILSNAPGQGPGPAELAIRLAGLAIGKPYRAPAAKIEVPLSTLDELAGVYRVAPDETCAVTRQREKLRVACAGSPPADALPAAPLAFELSEPWGSGVRFERDGEGRITRMVRRDRYVGTTVAERTDEPLPSERQAAVDERSPLRYAPRDHELVLSQGRLGSLRVADDFRYAGGQRFILRDTADAEQHLFVDTAEDGAVRRLYWIQIEEYLPAIDDNYDYSGDVPREIAGLAFATAVGVYEAPPAPGSDRERAFALLAREGYRVPLPARRARLVHLPDASGRREVMVIYVEAAPTGAEPSAEEREALLRRALDGLKLTVAADDQQPTHP